ncbi:MAG: DeoR family transcriptional regulator, partial [Hungatella sp.]
MKNKRGIIYKRRQLILEDLRNNHTINVEQLSKQLTVSPVTIRRDLDEFEKGGIIKRFYGGASLIEGSLSEDPFQNDNDTAELNDKDAIAKKAVELVADGDTI